MKYRPPDHTARCPIKWSYSTSGGYDVRTCTGCGLNQWDHGMGWWKVTPPRDYRGRVVVSEATVA